MNAGLLDCVGKAPDVEVPLNTVGWTCGQVRLDRTPRNVLPWSHDPRLTYANWCNTIVAIQGFVFHYPEIDFVYNTYGEDEYYSLALGALRKLSPPPTESS